MPEPFPHSDAIDPTAEPSRIGSVTVLAPPTGRAAVPREVTWRTRLRYGIDVLLSRGAPGLLLLSLLGGVIMLLALVPMLWILGGLVTGAWGLGAFVSLYWAGFLSLFDLSPSGGPWSGEVAALVFGIVALIFTGAVLGAVLNAIADRIDELRSRGGPIIAAGHTVILGWSPLGVRILSELALANANQGTCAVAVLTPGDKRRLEGDLSDIETLTTRVLVRSGSTTSVSDFDRVNLFSASHVIVLGDWDSTDHDIDVTAGIMAVARYRELHPEFSATVIACVKDESSLVPAKVAAKYPATVFDVRRLLARTMLQVCRQPGLFTVMAHLLQFEGDEFYYVAEPTMVGRRFDELQGHYPTSIPVGLVVEDAPILNPPGETIVGESDEIIFITEDDDTAIPGPVPEADPSAFAELSALRPRHDAESWLFTGWAPMMPDVLAELDAYLEDGERNSVTILARPEDMSRAGTHSQLHSIDLEFVEWDPRRPLRAVLDGLDVPERTYVVIPGLPDDAKSDNRTLMVRLHVRDILARAQQSDHEPVVVSELLEAKYRELSDTSDSRDIVVSSELVSLMLSQLSENPGLLEVYEDLFSAQGCEIYLKPAGHYVRPEVEVTFATVAASARRYGETAIGYRLGVDTLNAAANFGISINPPQDERLFLAAGDFVVVISAMAGSGIVDDGATPGVRSHDI